MESILGMFPMWSHTAASGVSPPISANLEVWLDATQLTGLVNNDPVSTWTDFSGNSRDFTQSGAARPTYQDAGVTINSLPVLQFVAATPQFVSFTGLDSTGWTGASAYIVGRINNDPPGGAGASGIWNWGWPAGNLNSHWPFTDGNVYDATFAGSRKTVGNPSASLATAFQINIITGASGYVFRMNQANVTSDVTIGFLGQTDPVKIGQSIDAGAYNYDGVIGEILVYSVQHNATDRNTIEAALNAKWGV